MNKNKFFELKAEICKALGHPLRIEIIDLLKNHEMCFSDILNKTGGLKSNLSQHLSILTKIRILKMRREGKCNHYSISSQKTLQIYNAIHELLIEDIKKQSNLLKATN